jgi:hypothetical protein
MAQVRRERGSMGWEYLADPGGYDEIEAYGGQLKIVMEGRDAERDEELGEEDGEGGHDAVVAAALESAMRIAGKGKRGCKGKGGWPGDLAEEDEAHNAVDARQGGLLGEAGGRIVAEGDDRPIKEAVEDALKGLQVHCSCQMVSLSIVYICASPEQV